LVYHGDDQYNSENSYILESLIALARIKLREELREDQGGVYGVSVYGGQSKYPVEEYAIQISFNADPPRTNELIEAMQKVINKLKESVDPADIVKITETQRQSRIKDLEQNRFWMNSFVDSWLDGSNMYEGTQLESLEKKIAGLDEAGLVDAANKYFNDSNLIRVVMFPENEKQE
jgi:zinc protease